MAAGESVSPAFPQIVTSAKRPFLPHLGVLALVPHRWEAPWASRHHLLVRLAQHFHVAWVNPADEWRDILKSRKISFMEDVTTIQPPGFTVYSPEWWLPRFYRPELLARFTLAERLRRARKLLVGRGCSKIVVSLWRPYFSDALNAVPHILSCYHIDDEYSFSDTEVPLDESERRLIERVDHVFITSRGLLEKKGWINPHTTFIPNGVNYRAFAEPAAEPPDLRPIPHPRIGYTGVIKRTLDWPLLLNLSLRHPEWQFVFVGPVNRNHPDIREPIREMSNRTNVHFLGYKPVDDLGAYPQHFDVCIMPYREDCHSAKYGYPLKLHEYLASGRPTVGTRFLSALEEFSHVVSLPATLDEWSVSIAEALSPKANTEERQGLRRATARLHDWDALVTEMAKTMARRMGEQFSDRFDPQLSTDIARRTCEEIR